MDLWIALAIALLVIWAVATFGYAAPGWVHMLLTVGMTLLIWRIVERGAANGKRTDRTTGR
jgi:Flp pilus assembly protein TadB